jgi:hypothetical protein
MLLGSNEVSNTSRRAAFLAACPSLSSRSVGRWWPLVRRDCGVCSFNPSHDCLPGRSRASSTDPYRDAG